MIPNLHLSPNFRGPVIAELFIKSVPDKDAFVISKGEDVIYNFMALG